MKKATTILFFLLVAVAFGQRKYTADKYYSNYAYHKAAKLYEKIYDKGDSSRLILQRLANSYYYNNNFKASEKWYEKLFELYDKDALEAEIYFRYAQSLKANGKYKKSDEILLEFRELSKKDSRGQRLVDNKNYFEKFSKGKEVYHNVHNLSINTKYSDYGGFITDNTVLFSSTRPKGLDPKGKIYARNNQPFYNIYKAKVLVLDKTKGITDLEDVKRLKKVNTKYHDANAIITKDGKTIYFTRDDYDGKKLRTDNEGLSQLKIYKATLVDNTWKDIVELPFNNSQYSNRHPALSPDEKTLYYASDKPGGFGKTDIYKVAINEDGTYGEPENLGKEINTEGIEMFPYVGKDSTLYFSSNGHIGLGGLDVFESKITANQKFSAVDNLGAPINSGKDDFAFTVNKKTKTGYFSSNRDGGKGDDDIYSFVVRVPCIQKVKGIIRDAKFKTPLEGAKLVIRNEENIVVKDTIVGLDGKFDFVLPCGKYSAVATKEYYKQGKKEFITTSTEEIDVTLDLEIIEELTYNDKVELIVKINPIYFDYNRSAIRSDAALELDKVVSLMNKYPEMEILSSSHTDARGRESYNNFLSDRRAKSTVQYIINKGISPTRIFGKGFGETKLTNDCVDNDKHTNKVKCTEEQHQANRRTEFVIIKM